MGSSVTPTFYHLCWNSTHTEGGELVPIFTMRRTTRCPSPERSKVWGQESWVPALGNGKSIGVTQQPGLCSTTNHCAPATIEAREAHSSSAQQALPPGGSHPTAEFSHSKVDPDHLGN